MSLVRALLYCLPWAWRNQSVHRSLWAGAPIITLTLKARAESTLGIKADSLVYDTFFLTDQFDFNLASWMRKPLIRFALPYFVFVWACIRYQRFHFFNDQGLIPGLERHKFNVAELRLLRTLGKELFIWSYGADVRTRERTRALGQYNCCTDCPAPGVSCVCDDEMGLANVRQISQYATRVFSMGDMIEYTPGSQNDLFFWPLDLNTDEGAKYEPAYPSTTSRSPLRIVHASNHREFKGTRFLIDAVHNIQRDGIEVDLQLVERVPNATALNIYRSADLIFDQCLIGFHGYFAIEAMAMGKPVMTYIRKPNEYLLCPDECPLINTRADRVEQTIRELIGDRKKLNRLGFSGRKYVEKHFTLTAFAKRLEKTYQDQKLS